MFDTSINPMYYLEMAVVLIKFWKHSQKCLIITLKLTIFTFSAIKIEAKIMFDTSINTRHIVTLERCVLFEWVTWLSTDNSFKKTFFYFLDNLLSLYWHWRIVFLDWQNKSGCRYKSDFTWTKQESHLCQNTEPNNFRFNSLWIIKNKLTEENFNTHSLHFSSTSKLTLYHCICETIYS